MIKNIVIGLLSLAMLVVTPMAVVDHTYIRTLQTQTLPFKQIRGAVWLLEIPGRGTGSGVMIADRRMLTAAHVASIDSEDSPLLVAGKRVKILKMDLEEDIALLDVDLPCPCVPIGDVPAPDTLAYLVGYPAFGQVGNQVLTEGRIMGLTSIVASEEVNELSRHSRIISTTPAAPGNSGGGLFVVQNGKWVLAGILVSVSGTTIAGMFPALITHLAHSVDTATILRFLSK